MLDHNQLTQWEQNGYIVLPGFFTAREVGAAQLAEARAWKSRHPDVVVDDLNRHERKKLASVNWWDRRAHIFKVNDLFLCDEMIRGLAMDARLVVMLRQLLGDDPVLCNSLSFTRGSQQQEHIDSLYMTPRTVGHLAATWIALEDGHDDAGPLFYFPGSHRIPLYRFADGSHHVSAAEAGAWYKYMRASLLSAGMPCEKFVARRGDLFIWHANLVHGGSEIFDLRRTRRSLVSHYFTHSDCVAQGVDLQPVNGGYWYRRPHQSVPQRAMPEKKSILPAALFRIPAWAQRKAS